MSAEDGFSRRTLLATPMFMALTGTAACAQEGTARMSGAKTLVAYLTRSGNTRVIAETLHRELGADIFEIRTARPYPEDYEQHVAQATRERDGSVAPPLAARVDDIAAYDEIFLGFPIWGETMPAPLRSFLKAHDLSGKTVRPFITHGGYGPGDAADMLSTLATGARVEKPFVLECDQERRTLSQIRTWLGQTGG